MPEKNVETSEVCPASDPILVSDGVKECKVMVFPSVSQEDLMIITDFGRSYPRGVAEALEILKLVLEGQAQVDGVAQTKSDLGLQSSQSGRCYNNF